MKFETQCDCLARNMECGPDCGCADSGACLNRAVTERRTLQLGADVHEIDSWGFDCYTRRNIHDGAATLPEILAETCCCCDNITIITISMLMQCAMICPHILKPVRCCSRAGVGGVRALQAAGVQGCAAAGGQHQPIGQGGGSAPRVRAIARCAVVLLCGCGHPSLPANAQQCSKHLYPWWPLQCAGGKRADPLPDSGRQDAVSQDVAAAVTAWVERVLAPAVNRQVSVLQEALLPA